MIIILCSCNKGWSSFRLVLPYSWELFLLSIVSGQSMNSWFDENKSILWVLIFSILFKMLSDGDGLLDHIVKIFWDFGCAAYIYKNTILFQNSEDFFSSDESNLGDTVLISQKDTDLRRGQTSYYCITFLGKLDDNVSHGARGQSHPFRSFTLVR
mgnify:CR=1 FL=1